MKDYRANYKPILDKIDYNINIDYLYNILNFFPFLWFSL